MELKQMEYFKEIADTGSINEAARRLHMSQPPLSYQMHQLEEELGVKLFIRTSKSVSLTEEGLMFLPDAQLILKTSLSAKERLGRHEHFVPFEIGCHNHMELNLLPPVIRQLSIEFPLLRPSIRLVPFPSLLGQVENQQVHAVFGTKEGQKKTSLYFRELCSAPVACVCSPEHPLARYETLTKRQLSGSLIVSSPRQISNSIFAVQNSILINLPPEQRYFTETVESAFTLARARIGYTLYPDIFPARETGLRYIPVTDLPPLSFGVYYRYDDDHPVLKRFLTLCSESVHAASDPQPG